MIRLAVATAAAGALVGVGLIGASTAASATTPGPYTCSGTTSLPSGTYSTVNVTGECKVNAGNVTVTGDVTVSAGASLVAAYALDNQVSGTTSVLTVDSNVTVASGATAILGCEASAFPCLDDPNPNNPTLNSSDTVNGDIEETGPLGVVVHDSHIGEDVVETGGGGGLTCTPSGVFASLLQSPVYSDYEDNTIGGNLRVTGLSTCWFGALRNHIGGSFTYSGNTYADPDASETLANHVAGNLICQDNSPAVQYGDSGSSPNIVSGFATGECAFGVKAPNPAPHGPLALISEPSTSPSGYWLGASDGGVFSFGVPFLGSLANAGLSQPVVGIAAAPGGGGYSLADANGNLFGIGANAEDCNGTTGSLNQPAVGVAAAPGGDGCWMTAGDGGVFAFGANAPFYGSAGALTLNKPVVGIAATPNNDGYYLVASDGGVFSYGPGATFRGSMGGQPLNQPVVGIATDPVTGGYWLVAADGGVFSFDAPFFGSMGGTHLNKPVVGIAAAPGGNGYYLVASDGGIFAFGPGAQFQGSTGGITLNKPVVGMALG